MISLYVEYILLVIFIIVLCVFLFRNKKNIISQKVLSFGGFQLVSMVLIKTKWGLAFMDYLAKKHREWVRLFGFISVGVGILGIFVNFAMLLAIIAQLLQSPQTQQIGLVLPFQEIPGLGYLSFSHWIIAIFILATVHEFAHGVVARAEKIPVDSSGFAFLALFDKIPLIRHLPIIPAAFVEPRQKYFEKQSDVKQYMVLTAGPVSNILLAIPFLLILTLLVPHLDTQLYDSAGFYFSDVNASMPAGIAGLEPNKVYNYYNGKEVQNFEPILIDLQYVLAPNQTISIGYWNETTQTVQSTNIRLTNNPNDPELPYMGVMGVTNKYEYKPEISQPTRMAYTWLKDLVRWLFIFNFSIGLINLMPLYITDGGQMMRIFANRLYSDKKKAAKLYHFVCSVSLYILLLAMIIPFLAGILF